MRARRGEIKTALLQIVATGGILSLAVIAPNMPKILPKSLLKKVFDRPASSRSAAISRLLASGYMARSPNGTLELTRKGRTYLALEQVRLSAKPVRQRRWDGKWRVVAFDISERQRGLRDKIRSELKETGFVCVQQSMWVYPFPCEEFVVMLKSNAHVGKRMLYMVVEELENDAWLRSHFGVNRM